MALRQPRLRHFACEYAFACTPSASLTMSLDPCWDAIIRFGLTRLRIKPRILFNNLC